MNSSALAQLQAAALKKRKGWKDPVVKDLKVTKEQYLQEKAEEDAKKNKKKAFLSARPSDDDDVDAGAAAAAATTATNSVTSCQALLRQIQSERQALQQEMQTFREEMAQHRDAMARQSVPVQQPATQSTTGKTDEATEALVTTLESRLDSLERKTTQQSKAMSLMTTKNNDGNVAEVVSRCESLEKRVAILEQKQQTSAAATPKNTVRAKSRGRAGRKAETLSPKQTSPKTSGRPKINNIVVTTPDVSPTKPVATPTSADVSDMEDFWQPHTAAKVAKHQARDETLVAYLERGATLYPKFAMSVKTVDGSKLVFFYKKLYMPQALREATLQHYHDTYPSWTKRLAKNVIWPSIDADITTFK